MLAELKAFMDKLRKGTATDDDFVRADRRAFVFGMTATVAGIVAAPSIILPAKPKVVPGTLGFYGATPVSVYDSSMSLGLTSKRWSDLFMDNLTVGGPGFMEAATLDNVLALAVKR